MFGPESIVFADGETFQFLHKTLRPLFTRDRTAIFVEIMKEETRNAIKILSEKKPWESIDVDALASNITLSVITKSMFAVDYSSNLDEIVKLWSLALAECQKRRTSPFRPYLHWWAASEYTKTLKKLNTLLEDAIYHHRTHPKKKGEFKDMIDMMLEAQESGATLTNAQIRDQCLSIFLAGYETTAHTMSWVLYLCATYPQIQQKVAAEADEIIGNRSEPNFEDLGRFTYLNMVCKETLRMYGPVGSFSREALEDTTLGPYQVSKGGNVRWHAFATHYNEKFWKDPWVFDPERFNEENSKDRHPYAWIPFSMGERACIGMHFAYQELKIVLGSLFHAFEFRIDRSRPVGQATRLTMSPAFGLHLFVRPRTPSA